MSSPFILPPSLSHRSDYSHVLKIFPPVDLIAIPESQFFLESQADLPEPQRGERFEGGARVLSELMHAC